MGNPQEPQPAVSPEAASALTGSFADVSDYFRNFSRTHFPHLNLVMIEREDPDPDKRIQDAVRETFLRPEVQNNLTIGGDGPGWQDTFERYADGLAASVKRNMTKNLPSTGSASSLGFYTSFDPPAEITNVGGEVSAIVIDSSAGCSHCSTKPQSSPCMEEEHPFSASTARLKLMRTGFHEIGHALDEYGKSFPAIIFRDIASPKDFTNRSESVADSFAAIMLAKEFGEMGVAFSRYEKRDPSTTPTSHLTSRAVNATLEWIEQNPDKIRELTQEQLFQEARKIGEKNALTPQEVREADAFQKAYQDPKAWERDAVVARIDTARQAHETGQPQPAGYTAMTEEMDRNYLAILDGMKSNVFKLNDLLDESALCNGQKPRDKSIDMKALPAPLPDGVPSPDRQDSSPLPPKISGQAGPG